MGREQSHRRFKRPGEAGHYDVMQSMSSTTFEPGPKYQFDGLEGGRVEQIG